VEEFPAMVAWVRHELTRLGHFLAHGGVWWGLGLSVVLAVGSLAIATAVVVGWAPNRFTHGPPPGHKHVVIRALGLVAKNVLGLLLVLVGMVMALPGVPGQGILTILIGITLLDFPGKLGIERRALKHPRMLHAINTLRGRFHRPPIEID
jgi:hypothetical protein